MTPFSVSHSLFFSLFQPGSDFHLVLADHLGDFFRVAMNKIPRLGLACLLIALFTGCAGFGHGYYKARARDQYLRVDKSADNFGYKRVQQITEFRKDAVKSFLEENGMPDYLYEYESNDREGFVFYYIKKRKAYDFIEQNWRPTSAKLVKIREFTDFEKSRFGL